MVCWQANKNYYLTLDNLWYYKDMERKIVIAFSCSFVIKIVFKKKKKKVELLKKMQSNYIRCMTHLLIAIIELFYMPPQHQVGKSSLRSSESN